MAIFRPSGFVGAISGNLGGVCFATGKAGPVIRQRNRRTRNTSDRATQTRAAFSILRGRWRGLTDAQRTAWRIAAANIPRANRLGIAINMSGYNLFIRSNLRGQLFRTSPISTFVTDPPTLTAEPRVTFSDFKVTTAGVATITVAKPIPTLTFSAAMYGARTFSTATRTSWYSFRFVNNHLLTPGNATIIGWDVAIGMPGLGEQCWLQIFETSTGIYLGGPIIVSTFAVAP